MQEVTKAWATRQFKDLYPDRETFLADYNYMEMTIDVPESEIRRIWLQLIGRYGESYLRLEEYAFRIRVFETIWMYYPEVYAKMQAQNALKALSPDQLTKGGRVRANQGANTNTPLTDAAYAGNLPHVDGMSDVTNELSLLNAVNQQFQVLKSGFVEAFFDRFNEFFRQILIEDADLWYTTEVSATPTSPLPPPNTPAPAPAITKEQIQQMIDESLADFVRGGII